MNTTTKFATLALGLAMALSGAAAASADTPLQTHHARRAEVNARLDRQEHRIAVKRREGEMSRREAHMLRARDRRIRHQERVLAAEHHGRITRLEQRRLNHEENAVSRRIGG